MSTGPWRFSSVEMTRRRTALCAEAEASGVEHVVLLGVDRSGSAVTWLSEWPVTREAALIVSPGSGEPDVLFVQHANHVPNAKSVAAMARVAWGGPSTVEAVVELLCARGARRGTVGVAGPLLDRVGARLRDRFGPLVSLDSAYQRLRLVKSQEELACLRAGAALTDRALEALAHGAGPRTSETECIALIEGAYLGAGGTNHIHYLASTPMAAPKAIVPAQFPGGRRLSVGDVLVCEVSAAMAGYAGQLLRTFSVGSAPTASYQKMHEVASEAFSAIAAAVKPGASVGDLAEAARVVERAGYDSCDDLVHGFGGGYLAPLLPGGGRPGGTALDFSLEAGMVLVVQPNVVERDSRSGVQTGELLLVGPHGPERLHGFARGLLRLG